MTHARRRIRSTSGNGSRAPGTRLRFILSFIVLLLPGVLCSQPDTPDRNPATTAYQAAWAAGQAAMARHNAAGAVRHFRMALHAQPRDHSALRALYESLVLSGNNSEARLLASEYSPEFQRIMGIPARRTLTFAQLESAYWKNTTADSMAVSKPAAENAQISLAPSVWQVSAGIGFEAGKRFSGTVSTSLTSFRARQLFFFGSQAPVAWEIPFDQRAIYLSGNGYLGKGFQLVVAGHALSYTRPFYAWEESETDPGFVAGTETVTDFAFHGSLLKQAPYVSLGLLFDLNRFRNAWFTQTGLRLTVYPAGNIKTSLSFGATRISAHGEVVLYAACMRNLFRSVWLEGECWFGETHDFSERIARDVFNNYDPISERAALNLTVKRLLPHLDLTVSYQYSKRLASWETWDQGLIAGKTTQSYPMHGIRAGFTWQF